MNPYEQGINADTAPATILDYRAVEEVVSTFYEIPVSFLYVYTRKWAILRPRQVVFLLLRFLGYRLREIAEHSGFDHSTVVHAARVMYDELQVMPDRQNELKAICQMLNIEYYALKNYKDHGND